MPPRGKTDQPTGASGGKASPSKDLGGKLAKEREQYKTQIDTLSRELEATRAENARLRKQQEGKFGMTLEAAEKMKSELDHFRTTNRWLLEDIDTKKEQTAVLERQTFETNMKMESCNKKMREMLKERQAMVEQIDDLEKAASKGQKYKDENVKLKKLLTKNRIEIPKDKKDKEEKTDGKGGRVRYNRKGADDKKRELLPSEGPGSPAYMGAYKDIYQTGRVRQETIKQQKKF